MIISRTRHTMDAALSCAEAMDAAGHRVLAIIPWKCRLTIISQAPPAFPREVQQPARETDDPAEASR